MKETYIYILKDPRTNKVRYVGKANNPEYRFKNHINKCRDKNTHKRNWINELRKEKLKPILEIIDKVSIEKRKEYEKFYIKKYLNDGCDLVNYTEGGDGCTYGNQTSFKPGNGARKIVMLDKKGNYLRTFDMILDAENYLGNTNNGVMQVLIKRNKTCKGLLFIYEEEYKNMTKEDIQKIVEDSIYVAKPNSGSWEEKSILQYDTNGILIKEWKSLSEASKKLNISKPAICHCLKNKSKTSNGFIWKYKK